ncbi:MAG: tellurite resistance/C4-dicarboxylate transporter family protein [Candidatus Methanoperedens sp.]
MRLKEILKNEASSLYPGYFAFVMATGIVSIASYLQGMVSVSTALFSINIAGYVILWVLTLIRLRWYFPKLITDLTSHVQGPGFFTLVAGTCILGNQFILISQDFTTAFFLMVIGTFLWLILIYAFFTAVIVRETKPTLETAIHGGWFIAVVATQSVSVLGALLASGFLAWKENLLFLSLVLYLLGSMLYLIIITLVFYRLTFFNLTPESFTPLYWVDMGAAAITTLAGGRLILASADWAFLQELLPFLKGFTLLFWTTATWWIPLLLILSVWRHYKGFPLGYEPRYWSLVFPLGMYTASTFVFAEAAGLAPLYLISRYFIYAALLAWVVTFIGMARRIGKILKRPGLKRNNT